MRQIWLVVLSLILLFAPKLRANVCMDPAMVTIEMMGASEQPPKPDLVYGRGVAESMEKLLKLSEKDLETEKGNYRADFLVELAKMIKDPTYVPKSGDVAIIRNDPEGVGLYTLYLATTAIQRAVLRPASWFLQLISPLKLTSGISAPIDYSRRGFKGWAYRNGQRLGRVFASTVTTFVPALDWLFYYKEVSNSNVVNEAFAKLRQSKGEYEPSLFEQQEMMAKDPTGNSLLYIQDELHKILNERKTMLDKFYEEKDALQKAPPGLKPVRNLVRSMFRGLTLMSALLIAENMYALKTSPDSFQRTTEFVRNHRLAPDEVAILTETTPFPHSAMMIGDNVYSFGQEKLSRTNVGIYLLRDQLPKPGEEIKQGSSSSSGSGSSSSAITGMQGLKRSVQVAVLKIGTDTVTELRRDLEGKVDKNYKNFTGVNDCSTMLMKSLGMENRIFDAGPGQVILWLSHLKTSGDPRVVGVYQLTNTDDHEIFMLRNAVINSGEAALLARLAVLNQLHRAYVDLAYTKEDLTFDTEATKQAINRETKTIVDETLRSKLKDLIGAEDQIRLFALQQKRLKAANQSDPKVIADLKKVNDRIASYVQAETKTLKEIVDDPNTPLHDAFSAKYRLELMEKAFNDGFDKVFLP